jgi:hypothetical protein
MVEADAGEAADAFDVVLNGGASEKEDPGERCGASSGPPDASGMSDLFESGAEAPGSPVGALEGDESPGERSVFGRSAIFALSDSRAPIEI